MSEWRPISENGKTPYEECLLFFQKETPDDYIIINGWWFPDEAYPDAAHELSKAGWETSVGFIGEPTYFQQLTLKDYPR